MVEELDEVWERRWPGLPKLPYGLRSREDRWVRFHTLQESKRYPDTEAEYATILERHNTVLTELAGSCTVWVMTPAYTDRPDPAGTVALQPGAEYWTTVTIDENESYLHLYVSQVDWSPGRLDPLLRQIADDEVANVVLADADLAWLYHPYDGGMDVLLPSTAERDTLKDRHSGWLSTHPAGV